MSNVTKLSLPEKNPYNIEAVKRYVFNETGNIMLASTDDKSDTIQDSVRNVFAEVAVFFAAMTKAISQTVNPNGKRDSNGNLPFYSMYNYDALSAIIEGSGYFVHVNEEDVSYSTSSWGANFSKELIEAILGLATGADALAFATAMVNSVGKEGLSISGQRKSLTSKVGNIIFVCEYLLGMPIVSAIVMTSDSKTVSQQFKLGPCFREQSKSTKMVVHKDTYMFVTPTFIKQYAGELSSIMNDPAYLKLISELESLVERTPEVFGLYEVPTTGDPVEVKIGSTLSPTAKYAIYGQYFGNKIAHKSAVTVDPPTGLTVNLSSWDNAGITFTYTNSKNSDIPNVTLSITLGDGTTKLSLGSFTFSK